MAIRLGSSFCDPVDPTEVIESFRPNTRDDDPSRPTPPFFNDDSPDDDPDDGIDPDDSDDDVVVPEDTNDASVFNRTPSSPTPSLPSYSYSYS